MYGPMGGVTRFINSVEICRKHSSDNEMLGPRINTLNFIVYVLMPTLVQNCIFYLMCFKDPLHVEIISMLYFDNLLL